MTESRVISSGYAYPEAPRWREGRLWFSDQPTRTVHSMLPDGSDARVEAVVPGQPSGLGWLPDGSLILVSMTDKRILRRAEDGSLVEVADLSDRARGALNDGVVDAQGRMYVGDYGFDLFGGEPFAPGSLFRIDPDGSVTTVAEGLYFPNGAVIVGKTLIVAETFGNRISAFTLDDVGNLSDRRVWAQFGELPDETDFMSIIPLVVVGSDGICLDSQGDLWVADSIHQRVLRVAEGQGVVEELPIGTGVFACALGGAGRDTLFLCTAPDFDADARLREMVSEIRAIDVATPGVQG